jgi:hypothetical protein
MTHGAARLVASHDATPPDARKVEVQETSSPAEIER